MGAYADATRAAAKARVSAIIRLLETYAETREPRLIGDAMGRALLLKSDLEALERIEAFERKGAAAEGVAQLVESLLGAGR